MGECMFRVPPDLLQRHQVQIHLPAPSRLADPITVSLVMLLVVRMSE